MNESDGLLLDAFDGRIKVVVRVLPVLVVLRQEDVVQELGEFEDLVLDLLTDIVNVGATTRHSGQVVTEDRVELLHGLTSRF